MPRALYRGKFLWHELMTTDTKAAAKFYARVIGWKTQAWPEDSSYMMFVAPTGPKAGLMALPEEARAMGSPPCWMCYIGTPDVDVTAGRTTKLGGKVLRAPEDIPSIGRFAVLQDPQGAVFLGFTPLPMPGAETNPKPELGEFSWHELATTDVKAAFDFYGELFGWEKMDAMDMGPAGLYQMYGLEGVMLGGMYNKPKDMPAPSHWLPYILVTDSKKTAAATTRAGGQVINGPMPIPGGDWIAACFDPQGALFAVHSQVAAAKPAPPKETAARKPAKTKKAKTKKTVVAKPSKKAARAKQVGTRKKATGAKKAVKKVAKKAPARKRATARPSAGRKKSTARKTARKPITRKRSAKF